MANSMDNIADLLGNLRESDLDALRETAQNLFGAQTEPTKQEPPAVNPEMLAKLGKMMQAMQCEDSGRTALIAALKPYLSTTRQKKADEAMQLLRLLDVLPLLGNELH